MPVIAFVTAIRHQETEVFEVLVFAPDSHRTVSSYRSATHMLIT